MYVPMSWICSLSQCLLTKDMLCACKHTCRQQCTKGEANTGKGCFWCANCLSLLGTWQPNGTPDWSVFEVEVLPQCLNVRLTSTLHRYLDYDHKNNAQNIFTCVSMCIIIQCRTHTLQSLSTAIAMWLEVDIPLTGCTRHHNIYFLSATLSNKLGKNWSWSHPGHS